MSHLFRTRPRRGTAVRPAEKTWEYALAPAERLHIFCLDALGVGPGEIWAVGVDYFRFYLRNGNTVLVGAVLDRLEGRYDQTLPVAPEELVGVEICLGYHRNGEYKRTFRILYLALERLELTREGERTVLCPVWDRYLTGEEVEFRFALTDGGVQTACEICYSDRLF